MTTGSDRWEGQLLKRDSLTACRQSSDADSRYFGHGVKRIVEKVLGTENW